MISFITSSLAAVSFVLIAAAHPLQVANDSPPARHKIVCTVGMVADIVRNIAADKADVSGLIGEGVDPHLYKASRNDIAALQAADAVFYSGLMLEGKMGDALVKLARSGKKIYAVTERIDEKFLLEPENAPGHHDPHVWMDVSAWARCVEAATAAMCEFDPPNAALYRANGERYRGELDKLHEYVKKSIATIPQKQRILITAHDAFNYFGRAYNLTVLGIQGISTESEAGMRDIERLVSTIVENDVQAVFIESSVAEKNVRALVEGAKARGKTVTIGGMLFSDAMGATGTYEGTYIGMLDHNATLITRALGGQAPEKGMQGKLSAKKDVSK